MKDISPKTILLLSIPQALLIITAGCVGLFVPGFYMLETFNWQTQTFGQDITDVFVVSPVLIVSAIVTYRNKKALCVWGGVNLYLVYTFAIFCFDVRFNQLFLVYCMIFGLSFYSLVLFILRLSKEDFEINQPGFYPYRFTAIYFIIIACLFYFLWLSEIVPAVLENEAPATLTDVGLLTNPVHVIDLAILLPALFINGVLILRRKIFGYQLAPVMLTFLVLMDITIGFLTWLMMEKGFGGNFVLVAVMGALAFLSFVLLTSCLKGVVLRNS